MTRYGIALRSLQFLYDSKTIRCSFKRTLIIKKLRTQPAFAAESYRPIESLEYHVDKQIGSILNMRDAAAAVIDEYIAASEKIKSNQQSQTFAYTILQGIKSSRDPIMAVIRLLNVHEMQPVIQQPEKCALKRAADSDESNDDYDIINHQPSSQILVNKVHKMIKTLILVVVCFFQFKYNIFYIIATLSH